MPFPRSRLAPFFSLSPFFCSRGYTRLSRSSQTDPESRNYSLAREVGGVPYIKAPRLSRNAEFPLPPVGRSSRLRGRFAPAPRPSRARCCRASRSLAVPPELVAPWAPSMSAVRALRARPADNLFDVVPSVGVVLVLYWCCIGVSFGVRRPR